MSTIDDLLFGMPQRVTPRVFVSYHHDNDQPFYDGFKQLFDDRYEVFTDTSLREEIESENTEYVLRRIREDYIKGSSVTVVLCGTATWRRKYVDWEIKATLDKEHALLGIQLPTLQPNDSGKVTVPDRLAANIQSGYALWKGWPSSPDNLASWLETARGMANETSRIINNQPMMQRNRP